MSSSQFLEIAMAEYIYLSNKDTLIIKPSKKSPLLLRLIALLFAVVCGVFFLFNPFKANEHWQ